MLRSHLFLPPHDDGFSGNFILRREKISYKREIFPQSRVKEPKRRWRSEKSDLLWDGLVIGTSVTSATQISDFSSDSEGACDEFGANLLPHESFLIEKASWKALWKLLGRGKREKLRSISNKANTIKLFKSNKDWKFQKFVQPQKLDLWLQSVTESATDP